jgi:hypothetical protein
MKFNENITTSLGQGMSECQSYNNVTPKAGFGWDEVPAMGQ